MIISRVGGNISRCICIAIVSYIINVAGVDICFTTTASNAVAWLYITIVCIISAYIVVGWTIGSITTVTNTSIHVAAVRTHIVVIVVSFRCRATVYCIIETVICIIICAKSNSINLFGHLIWFIDNLFRCSRLFFTDYSWRWLISICPYVAATLAVVFPIGSNRGDSHWGCSNIIGVDWAVCIVGFVTSIVVGVTDRLRQVGIGLDCLDGPRAYVISLGLVGISNALVYYLFGWNLFEWFSVSNLIGLINLSLLLFGF